jgi:PAS domain S-box-containing protein
MQKEKHTKEFISFKTTSDRLRALIQDQIMPSASTDSLDILQEASELGNLISQLKEAEQRFFKMFWHSPFPACVISELGYFIEINPACEELWGYSRQELKDGMRWQELIDHDFIFSNEKMIKELKDENVHSRQIVSSCSDKLGNKKNILLTYTAVKGKKDEILYLISQIVSQDLLEDYLELIKRGLSDKFSH